jgi:hypothetical protein
MDNRRLALVVRGQAIAVVSRVANPQLRVELIKVTVHKLVADIKRQKRQRTKTISSALELRCQAAFWLC